MKEKTDWTQFPISVCPDVLKCGIVVKVLCSYLFTDMSLVIVSMFYGKH